MLIGVIKPEHNLTAQNKALPAASKRSRLPDTTAQAHFSVYDSHVTTDFHFFL
jgi:hypothetical protein